MKVLTYGFSLESPYPDVPLDRLIDALISGNGKPDQTHEIERRIYVDKTSHNGFWVGLVVSVRDQKRFCSMEAADGKLTIAVKNLSSDQKIMEFNFFALNSTTGRGVYQHYYQSCSIGRFDSYLQARFRALSESRALEVIAGESSKKKLSDEDREKIKSKYQKRLKFERMCSKETLDKLLQEYKRIAAFEYDLAAIAPTQHSSGAVPLGPLSRKIRQKFSFKLSAQRGQIINAIMSAISHDKPSNGKAFVVDAGNVMHALRIFDMPESFSEEDYDSVAEKLDKLDVSEFGSCKVVGALVNICKAPMHKALFMP